MSKLSVVAEPSRGTPKRDAGAIAQPWIVRWIRVLRASGAKVDKAHAQRCELASLPPEVLRDTGVSPEDATGIASHQPALPFFMQDGFGRR